MAFVFASFIDAQTKEERSLSDFNQVSFGISGDLFIAIGPEFSVVLEGYRDDLEETETEVSSGRLIIRRDDWGFRNSRKVTVRITMPELEGLSVSGSGKAEILDPVSADELNFAVSGSGNLYAGRIEADDFKCSISGSGNILIEGEGSIDDGEITISGSGGYSGDDLEIDHLDVRVSGSGNCSCRAGDSITASISGSGNVTYSGDPRVDARVSGSGKVRSR